mmetsp:Transcript_66022/g.123120  ORF Transcript_66022/g.123120 Transcript_66022/m.123120 type:complete len:422 (-) Transcript_66022:30-1295(-)
MVRHFALVSGLAGRGRGSKCAYGHRRGAAFGARWIIFQPIMCGFYEITQLPRNTANALRWASADSDAQDQTSVQERESTAPQTGKDAADSDKKWQQHAARRATRGGPRSAKRQASDASGAPISEGGPILADYLALGAGRVYAPPTAERSARVPQTTQQSGMLDTPREESSETTPAAFKRRLQLAAHRRGEALSVEHTKAPKHVPVPPVRAQPQAAPEFYHEAADRVRHERSRSPTDSAVQARAQSSHEEERHTGLEEDEPIDNQTDPQSQEEVMPQLQLRVRRGHRHVLLKLVCKKIVWEFLQHHRRIRQVDGNPAIRDKPILLFWEHTAVMERSEAGEVVKLVRYLLVTDEHIRTGQRRKQAEELAAVPSSMEWHIRHERKDALESSGITRRHLSAEMFLRLFLDGQLSWQHVREEVSAA